jgi:hypothetical protein
MRSSSPLARLALFAPLACVAVATALAAPRDAHPASLETLRTAGAAASLTDSNGGAAILRADDMRAGSSVSGDVTIGWSGETPAAATLAPGGLDGPLADALAITVDDRTSGRRVYDGPLAAMGSLPLDGFAPGASRDFRFTVTLSPDAGNAYQGKSASVRFDWIATADEPQPPVTPTTSTPTPPPTGTTPTNPVSPPVVDTRPPRVKVAVGKLSVTASCNEPCSFRASAKLSRAPGAKRPKLAVKSSGRRATIRLRFDKRSLAALRKARGKAKAAVTVVATDAAGNRATTIKRIALKP